THEIAHGKAEVSRLPGAVARGYAIPVGPAHLAHAMPGGHDRDRKNACTREAVWRSRAHAGRVEPVRLGQPSLGAVPLRASARADFYRQYRVQEAAVERPARGIHRGRVRERPLRLRLQLREAELHRRPRPLALITGFAGERQVADPISAAPAPGRHVL